MKKIVLALVGICGMVHAHAQNYQALHGSPYSGSLSNDFNPAAILNSPYSWDLTLFGAQVKAITNVLNVSNASLISQPDTLKINYKAGNYTRYVLASADIHLLNARIGLGRRQAIAFGLNIRNYARLAAGPYNYTDTTKTAGGFLGINENNVPLQANLDQASWLEFYGTYSRVFFEDDNARFQGGATLQLLRSLSGAYLYGENASYVPNGTGGYNLTNIAAQYGYSENYDTYNAGETAYSKFKEAVKLGSGGFSFNIGAEWVQKTGQDWGEEAKSGTDVYDWKLGVALLDVGYNHFRYGTQSAAFSGVQQGQTDSSLNAFDNIHGLEQFNDSVRSRVTQFGYLSGGFNMVTPARVLVNFDKRLAGYWAVNGELSLNFSGIKSSYASVQELNLITVTPRWEKSELGAYLPIEVTDQGRFWVGGAVKAGPLLLGLHNLAWLVSKKSMPNGGGYLAIIIHPGEFQKEGVKCPTF
jgi:hypothetical protein